MVRKRKRGRILYRQRAFVRRGPGYLRQGIALRVALHSPYTIRRGHAGQVASGTGNAQRNAKAPGGCGRTPQQCRPSRGSGSARTRDSLGSKAGTHYPMGDCSIHAFAGRRADHRADSGSIHGRGPDL